jgi:integrase
LMLLMARHGLRVTEAIDLRWDQIDFSKGHLHVRRLKGGFIPFTRFRAMNCEPCAS